MLLISFSSPAKKQLIIRIDYRQQLMVFPFSVDLNVFPGDAFFVKARLLQHPDRGKITGHDAGFDAMELEILKGELDHQLDGFCRVAFAVVFLIQK